MAVKKINDKYIVLTNVIFMWPKVQEPGLKYNSTEQEYSVECLVDAETVKGLKALKVNKTFKDASEKYPEHEGRWSFKAANNVLTAQGKELQPPFVLDTSLTPISEKVGNGSTGQVKLFCMEGQGLSKGKLNIKLNGLMVTNLVVYEGSNQSEGFEVDDDDIPF